MKSFDFSVYKTDGIKRFSQILDSHEEGACDEQGLPSYTNPNPLMRWLVWKRVKVVIEAIGKHAPYQRVLDFGCGYGVFLPYLNNHAQEIFAYDLAMDEIEKTCRAFSWENVHFAADLQEIKFMQGSFDLILAVEVLEHIDNLDETAALFAGLLAPGGHLIIAGPTENWLYKFGRRLAGYSGEYHKQNIDVIRKVLEERFAFRKIATLVPGFPFYEVYDCTIK
jgi:2-polyprenyl-3-methyl-5-hydroxy-6-metoxy-1,4-benzoquinol methylase